MVWIFLYLLTLPVTIILKRRIVSIRWKRIISFLAMAPVIVGSGLFLETVFSSVNLQNEKLLQFTAFGAMIYIYRLLEEWLSLEK
jgi:hypothetical protein